MWRKTRRLSLILAASLVAGPGIIVAASTSQAYKSAQPLAAGTMVSLDTSTPGTVLEATPANATKLAGVVVPTDSATLQFNVPGAGVQVAQSGLAPVLVSDLNGAIKAGDNVTVSIVQGVGMKATDAGVVIGTAQTDFDTNGAVAKTIITKTGASREIHIAQVKVALGIRQITTTKPASYVPTQLQTLADTISGGPTSGWRVLTGSLIILVTLIVIGAIIYSGIRSSLISIGRNPLAAPAIYRSLFQLVVITVGLLFIGLLGVYLILTL